MKILFAVANSGCAYWRVKQPCKMIQKKGLAEAVIYTPDMPPDEVDELAKWADVVVMQSSMGVSVVASTAKMKTLGKAVVGDYDDLSFSVSPFNPSYKEMGLKEVKVKLDNKDEEYLWQDNVNGFSIKANYFRYKSLQDMLKTLTMVTTTGRYIKAIYGEFRENITILPNSIDFNLFKPFPKEDTGQIRIGWTPSDSHYSEIWMVKRIMRKIFDKYKDKVKLVILGNLFELGVEFKPHEYERHNFIGLDVYPLKLADLNLDIGLCPLDDIEFNKAKSQLKWSEYSSMKVPSVVSKLEPYVCVKDYETGLVGKDEDEFFDKLCELIDSEELRKKLTKNAYDQNYEEYNLDKNITLWMDAYERAMDSKGLPVLEKGQLVKEKCD